MPRLYDQEFEELCDWLRQNYSEDEIKVWNRTLHDIHNLPIAVGCPND